MTGTYTNGVLALVTCAALACASTAPAPSVSDVVAQLASSDRTVANRAVRETVASGEAALPALLALRGNRAPFRGDALGNPRSAQLTFDPDADVEPERLVTVEVAALYLIEAIHRHDLHFAQSAYLTDVTEPPDARTAANTPERIARAWESAAAWITTAGTTPGAPLSGSGVQFW